MSCISTARPWNLQHARAASAVMHPQNAPRYVPHVVGTQSGTEGNRNDVLLEGEQASRGVGQRAAGARAGRHIGWVLLLAMLLPASHAIIVNQYFECINTSTDALHASLCQHARVI